jgi:spore germination protein YaaH
MMGPMRGLTSIAALPLALALALASTPATARADTPASASPVVTDPTTFHAHQYFDDTTGPLVAGVERGSQADVLTSPKIARTQSGGIQTSTTAPPAREVLGFAQTGEVTSGAWRTDLQLSRLTTVAAFGINLNSDGSIVNDAGYQGWWSAQMTSLIDSAHSAGDRVVLVVKDFSSSSIETLVSSEANRQHAISAIMGELTNRGGDGVNIDFEGSAPTVVASDFTTFISELQYALRQSVPLASYLTVDTYGSSAAGGGMFDIPHLKAYVDAFDVMAYDITSPGSSHAGPVAPLDNYSYSDTRILNEYLKVAPASQVILGVPYYGYKWSVTCSADGNCPMAPVGGDSSASAGTYSGIFGDFACALQLHQFYDSNVNVPWATWWSPASGDPCGGNHNSWRELYWDNSQSLGLKYDLVNTHAVRGIGIWALGYDSGRSELWTLLGQKFSVDHGPGATGGTPPVRPSLSRYIYPGVGHWVTAQVVPSAWTGRQPGWQEFSLGSLSRTSATGLQALYGCAAGEKIHFLSLASNCEGQSSLGLEGYISKTSAGAYTSPVYRCRVSANNDHFASQYSNCEGQIMESLLGYAALRTPLVRYYKPSTGDHWSTNGAGTVDYSLDNVIAWVLSRPGTNERLIYACQAGLYRFTSTASNCEGQVPIGQVGWVYSVSTVSGTVPLYRCDIPGTAKHFDTTSFSCEGAAANNEGVLGYVATSA